MDAGKAYILASGEPIAAMFFGIFFYHEIPTVLSVIGVLLTLTALTLLSLPEKINSLYTNNTLHYII